MEKKAIDLTRIKPVAVTNESAIALNNKVLQLASVMVCFSIKEIEEISKEVLDHIPHDAEIEAIMIKSFTISNKLNTADGPEQAESDKLRMLKDAEKNKILISFANAEEMKGLVNRLKLDSRSKTQALFNQYVNGVALSLNEQNLSELSATYNIVKWLKSTEINIPTEESVILRIKEEQLLDPFRNLTKNFRGRESELKKLIDYVDWLPKTGLTHKTRALYRKIINWNEKPPLLINGIGGVGKSTLIARFITLHLNANKREKLPFIYFDFDKPGLSVSEPVLLAIPALSQLSVQFPANRDFFLHISNDLYNEYANKGETSRTGERSLFYYKYLREFVNSEYSNMPILIVFDSFEELQFRANSSEISNLFQFLQELTNYIPRLRPVFVGRSEIINTTFKFDLIPLEEFDKDSAIGYLESVGISYPTLAEKIFEKFHGNPLTLHLAADWINKNKVFGKGEKLDDARIDQFFLQIDDNLVQEQLVLRNLDHIHDERVQKIAIPGIIVRKINPEVIQKILAEPCGLGNITAEESQEIFTNLEKETFLITSTEEGITFRQDLRMSLYPLITKSPKYKYREVHDKAVKFYQNRQTPEDRAECLYHRLKRGDSPALIDQYYNSSVRVYIENSLKELPPDARIFFARILGTSVSAEILKQASNELWEQYYIKEITDALQIGDEIALQDIKTKLLERNERIYNSALHYYEAKVNERLGEFQNALQIITLAKSELKEDEPWGMLRLQLLEAKIYENEKNFLLSLEVLSTVVEHSFNTEYSCSLLDNDQLKDLIDLKISILRMVCRRADPNFDTENIMQDIVRLVNESALRISLGQDTNDAESIKKFICQPYNLYYSSGMSADRFVGILKNSFYREDKFEQDLLSLTKRTNDKVDLEEYLRNRYNRNLKEICEPGILTVNVMDTIRFIEINPTSFIKDRVTKRIIVCCDGTWDQKGWIDHGIVVQTNVEKIFNCISSVGRNEVKQLKTYDEGSGFNKKVINRLFDGIVTDDIDKRIKDMYTFIALSFLPGDEIYLFGFSKGAYIARCITGMIRVCGILKRENIHLVDKAYEYYRDRSEYTSPDSDMMRQFRESYSHETRIKFIGVWETVGSLGIPVPWYQRQMLKKYQFHDVKLIRVVEYAYQALAVDERRRTYLPTLWEQSRFVRSNKNYHQTLEQRWFPGVHGNVGGGYADSGLSDIALNWMIEKAKAAGLSFDESITAEIKPNFFGVLRNSTQAGWFSFPDWRTIHIGENNCTLDESVYERYKDANYRPRNLEKIISSP